MQDRACKHGYVGGECEACVQEGNLRAFKVAYHYAYAPNRNAVPSRYDRWVGTYAPQANHEERYCDNHTTDIAHVARKLVAAWDDVRAARKIGREEAKVPGCISRQLADELQRLVQLEKSRNGGRGPAGIHRVVCDADEVVAIDVSKHARVSPYIPPADHLEDGQVLCGRCAKPRRMGDRCTVCQVGTFTRSRAAEGARMVDSSRGQVLQLWIGEESLAVRIDRHTTAGLIVDTIKRKRPDDCAEWLRVLREAERAQ
jgi:hypothetical protein